MTSTVASLVAGTGLSLAGAAGSALGCAAGLIGRRGTGMLRAWAFVSCLGTDPRPGSGWLWVRGCLA